MSDKQKFNIFEKNVWYSCDFGRFFVEIFHDLGWFFATRIRFMAELKRIRNTEFNIHIFCGLKRAAGENFWNTKCLFFRMASFFKIED